MTKHKESNMVGVIIVCAVIGIVFAMIIQNLNTQGILIPDLLTGVSLTLGQLMFVVFFMWVIVGIILGATLF